ncbi:MAG: FixH family protein [Alphaproteobacteria bacterium]|nr:FixH family protein [Alphaproteobacteria bacterium]
MIPLLRRQGRDWWVPWTFIGFFGVVFAANGVLAYLAFDTWTGLTTKGAYEKGLDHNRTVQTAEDQRRTGWTAAVGLAPSDGGRTKVTVELRGRDGQRLQGAQVVAHFIRPTQAGHDVDLPLSADRDGRYVGEVVLPLPGQWEVRLDADVHGRAMRWVRRVERP